MPSLTCFFICFQPSSQNFRWLLATISSSALPYYLGGFFCVTSVNGVSLLERRSLFSGKHLLFRIIENFKHIMKELQGAIIISSAFQAILGYSGLMSVLLRLQTQLLRAEFSEGQLLHFRFFLVFLSSSLSPVTGHRFLHPQLSHAAILSLHERLDTTLAAHRNEILLFLSRIESHRKGILRPHQLLAEFESIHKEDKKVE